MTYKITVYRPNIFWSGIVAILFGVISHFPMFIASADNNYQMNGMLMSNTMILGMIGIVFGVVFSAYGLLSNKNSSVLLNKNKSAPNNIEYIGSCSLTKSHWYLFFILVIALIVDVMKPVTLGFVMPGIAAEYGLSKSQASIVPIAGILGTVMGSFLWGWLGDNIGRRASILLSAIIFIATSICGSMPSFYWNVFMCWLMGLGAGGMLPIVFTLLSEILPIKQRGWLIVLLSGIGTVGGYLAASGSASLLEPVYGWRILWLLGLPTGLILIVLNRYIPESPSFLMSTGKIREATNIMNLFNMKYLKTKSNDNDGLETKKCNKKTIFSNSYFKVTIGLGLYGSAWGLVNFGFLLWLPINLREIGLGVEESDALLARSAIYAIPSTIVVAYLYFKWNTKYTMVLFALLTALTLSIIAYLGNSFADNQFLMTVLLVSVMINSSSMIILLPPYAAEIYPTHIRGTGSGWAAGWSKAAGVITLSFAAIGINPSISSTAFVAVIILLISTYIFMRNSIEV